jgi:hypothetical protein
MPDIDEHDLLLVIAQLAVAFAPGVIARTRRMKAYAGLKARTNVVNFGLAAVAATGFALSAFGLPASNPSATFIAALVALLCICAIVFFRVIASILGPHAPA